MSNEQLQNRPFDSISRIEGEIEGEFRVYIEVERAMRKVETVRKAHSIAWGADAARSPTAILPGCCRQDKGDGGRGHLLNLRVVCCALSIAKR